MKKILILILFTLAAGHVLANSPIKVSGWVTDANGAPLPYASVVIKDKMIGVSTDRDGRFSIDLPDRETYTLVASFTGYETRETTVSGEERSPLEFRLPEDLMNISTVVVTGTRTPKLLKETPVQTRVITADVIRRSGVVNIAQLLQAELPALEFTYSMNQQVSIDMQGFGGLSVLFLIDGERLAGETLDNIDYSRLTVDNVERVEIVKGAASSLYGSNAVGAVVNIITREAEKPWSATVNTRQGSHNEQGYGASVGIKQGRLNSMTDFRHDSQDSYSLGDAGDYTTLLGNSTYSLKERLGITLSDRVKLVARGGYYFRERDYDATKNNRYRDFSGGLRMLYAIDGNKHLEASYSFDQYDKSNYSLLNHKDIREYSNIQNTVRVLYNRVLGGGHILTLGADGMTDYLMSKQFEDNGDHDQISVDVFAQFDWKVCDRFDVVAGARLDYYSEVNELRLSPKLGVMYRLDDFALRASYSAGFQAPSLKEMHMNFDMAGVFNIYGNPDLKSSTSHNFMASAEYLHRYFTFTFSSYYNSIDNRITTIWNEELNGMKYVNDKQVDVFGAEANLAMKLPCGFGGRMSYAYTQEFRKPGVVKTSFTRPLTGMLQLEYGRKFRNYSFNVILAGRFMSPVETNTLTAASHYQDHVAVRYPGYSIWNLTVTQQIWRPFTLHVSVNNLLNYKPDYFYFNSPTTYGTMFTVGLSVNIEKLFKNR